MTKPAVTQNDTAMVGAQFIAPEDFDTAGNGWRECSLGEIAQINPTEKLVKGSIAKKIDMAALQPFTKKPQYVLTEPFNGGMKFKNGDTVIARITPCLENGKTAYIDVLHDKEVGFGSTEYIVLREKDGLSDKEFLYYFATSSVFRDVAILSMTGSSGRQRVQTDVVTNHVFEIPPLPEQKAIAAVLSSLDDKIDLLHRQNQTLEAMAQTLFRQWFIEEAREDWEDVPLITFGQIICGKTPSKKLPHLFGGDVPFIKIPDMHGNAYVLHTEDTLSDDGKNSQLGKTLPVHSICVSCIATVGLVSFNAHEAQTNQQINAIIPSLDCYRYYLYLFMKSAYDEINAMASGGTATLNLNTGNFAKMLTPQPDLETLKGFDEVVAKMFEKILVNSKQIQTLTQLRDTLLAKLMSGEIRVEA